MEAGRNAVFVWSAYGVAGFVLAGLVLRAVLDGRAQRQALRRLEGRPED